MNTHTSRSHSFRSTRADNIQMIACAFILIAAVVAMSGCGKKEEAPSQTQSIALTPFDAQMQSCVTGQPYQGQEWNHVSQSRHRDQFRGRGSRARFENRGINACAPGQQPLCDAQVGMVCIDVQSLNGQNLAMWTQGQNGFVRSGYSAYGQLQGQGQNQFQGQSWDGHGSAIGRTCEPGTLSCGPDAFCNPQIDQNFGVCTQ